MFYGVLLEWLVTVILNNKTVRDMEQIRFQEHISLEIITKRRLIFKF